MEKYLSNATRSSNGVIIAINFRVETRLEGSSLSVFTQKYCLARHSLNGFTTTQTKKQKRMTTVKIGSHEINIPDTQLDGLTGARFKELANVSPDKVLVGPGPNGNRTVPNDKPLDLQSGQQFHETTRFRTAGRNISRINEELRLLVAKYGNNRVYWLPTLEWVLILNWPLPTGWSRPATNLVVFLPDSYGFSAPLMDCVIDPGLKFNEAGEWVEPPHYYGGEKKYMPESLKKFANKDWRYLCVHAEEWNTRDSIFTYLDQLQHYLSNPNYDWNGNMAHA